MRCVVPSSSCAAWLRAMSVRSHAGPDRATVGADRITTAGQARIGMGLQRVVGIRRGVAKVWQKGAILSCVGVDSQTVAGIPDESRFHNVANRRDGRTIGSVFEVKKEIPA